MKISKFFVVATLFATLSLGLLSCEDKELSDDKLVNITVPTSGTEKGYEDVIWYDFDSSTKTASVTYKGEDPDSYYDEYTGEVVIPSTVMYEGEEYNVTEIGDSAFSYCHSLTSITLPSSVTRIGKDAFSGCSSLTSVTIPESVKMIGGWAFSGCISLTSIDVASNNNNYTSIDGVLFSKDKTILIQFPGGKKDVTSYIIPEGVTEIGDYAFRYCSSLTSITIPKGVTEIGNYAFCSSLTSITSMNATPLAIRYGVPFYFVDRSIPVYVPKQSVEAYKNAEGWENFRNIQAIP